MTGSIFPIGVGTASLYTRLAAAGSAVDTLTDPGDTNTPIIFEPPTALSGGAYEVWLIASGGADWGGCQVWISIDNATYALAGTIYRGARQGTLTASLPDHPDPDDTDMLSVDLAQSQGQLLSGTQADADSLLTLCYVDGELISYQNATLTAAYKYDLTYLRRGVYGTAVNAHSTDSNFARFGPGDQSLFKYRFPGNFVGQTIHVKLPAFNMFGQALQDLSGLAADTYTLTGAGVIAAVAIPIQFLGAPQAGQPITRYTFGRAAVASCRSCRKHVQCGDASNRRTSTRRWEKRNKLRHDQLCAGCKPSELFRLRAELFPGRRVDDHAARDRRNPGRCLGVPRRQQLIV